MVVEEEIKEGIQEHKHPIYTLIISPLEASKRMPHANNSPSPRPSERERERGREGGKEGGGGTDYSSYS